MFVCVFVCFVFCVCVCAFVFDWVWQEFCNFPQSRSLLSNLLSCQSPNHRRICEPSSLEDFCHFSIIIISAGTICDLWARLTICVRIIPSFHHNSLMVASSDWCSALSPVSSKLPSEGEGVVKFGRKFFAFGRASWAHYANNFYSNLLLKLCTAFISTHQSLSDHICTLLVFTQFTPLPKYLIRMQRGKKD